MRRYTKDRPILDYLAFVDGIDQRLKTALQKIYLESPRGKEARIIVTKEGYIKCILGEYFGFEEKIPNPVGPDGLRDCAYRYTEIIQVLQTFAFYPNGELVFAIHGPVNWEGKTELEDIVDTLERDQMSPAYREKQLTELKKIMGEAKYISPDYKAKLDKIVEESSKNIGKDTRKPVHFL